MREYQCVKKCYDGAALSRPGDIRTVPESLFAKTSKKVMVDGKETTVSAYKNPMADIYDKHWVLLSDDGKIKKPSDPEAGVKAFLTKNEIDDKLAKKIYAEARATEPHEKLKALSGYLKAMHKE
jgi:hypothetical protein